MMSFYPSEQCSDSLDACCLSTHFIGHQPADDAESYMSALKAVVQLGTEFKTSLKVNMARDVSPKEKTFGAIPAEGVLFDGLMESYRQIAQSSTNWASPTFVGFPDAGNSLPAVAASVLVPLLNQNLANQDICSPSATFIEMELVHWLRGLLGYAVAPKYSAANEIGGVLTLGGCLSNTIALMAAREKQFPNSRLVGLPVLATQICVLVPDIIEHYSIRSAMAWLGMGEQNVIRIPVDNKFRMKLDELEKRIDSLRHEGKHILACVAYAGDSRSMCVDDLKGIANVLQEKNIWFHIDACHGFQLCFSDRHRGKLEGIHMADSVTVDPHKVLWVPATCSLILFKRPGDLAEVSTNSDLILKTQWSLGQITPFIGSKAFDALKLWSTIKYFGSDQIGLLIDARLEMTQFIQTSIRNAPDLLLLNETDINSCMFQFIPRFCQSRGLSSGDLEKINRINQFMRTEIIREGDFYVHGFTLKTCSHPLLPQREPVYVLRMLNGNALLTPSHVDTLINKITSLGWFALGKMQFVLNNPPERLPCILQRLRSRYEVYLRDFSHITLLYGSSVNLENNMISDIDVMTFVEDEFCTENNILEIVKLFKEFTTEEGLVLDDEVPLGNKLLIPLSLALKAATTTCQLVADKVVSINKSPEFLKSDTMITRLCFNVLTTPTVRISGHAGFLSHLQREAEQTLLEIATRLNLHARTSKEDFIAALMSDGMFSADTYLGYKNRIEIRGHLADTWSRLTVAQ